MAARRVGHDGLVAFEGRQYSVRFRLVGNTVEVRFAAGAVQVLRGAGAQGLRDRRLPPARHRAADQRHYDGPSTERVIAPPLGRMGVRIQELATMPMDLPAARPEDAASTYFCDAYASWQKGGVETPTGGSGDGSRAGRISTSSANRTSRRSP